MDVRVIGIQALVDREPGPERQVGFVAAALRLHVDRPEQFLQRAAMLVDRFSVALYTPAGQRSQVLVLEFDVEPRNLVAQLLQRELQAVAPLTETGVRIRKHPRDAVDVRKIDLAGLTAKPAVVKSERCLVAARAGEIILQLFHVTHAPFYSTAPRTLPDALLT